MACCGWSVAFDALAVAGRGSPSALYIMYAFCSVRKEFNRGGRQERRDVPEVRQGLRALGVLSGATSGKIADDAPNVARRCAARIRQRFVVG